MARVSLRRAPRQEAGRVMSPEARRLLADRLTRMADGFQSYADLGLRHSGYTEEIVGPHREAAEWCRTMRETFLEDTGRRARECRVPCSDAAGTCTTDCPHLREELI